MRETLERTTADTTIVIPPQLSSSAVKQLLPNGITVIVDREPRFASVACVCCLLGGTRGEEPDSWGITHALEHLLFRRTNTKDTRELSYLIDDMGGEVNACTDAESLCLYGLVPQESFPRLLEFFRELLCESAFTDEDVELEKEVIRQEILEAEDDPADAALTRFYSTLWGSSYLGRPIFGSLQSVSALRRPQIKKRQIELLQGRRLLFAIAGDVDPEAVCTRIEADFGDLQAGARDLDETLHAGHGVSLLAKPVNQVHLALGCPWPSQRQEQFLPGLSLSALLGSGMSSRLFQILREERGLVYDVRADVESTSTAASLVITAVLERAQLGEALTLIFQELDRLSAEAPSAEDVARIHRLQRAQLAMDVDRLMSRAWRALESELAYERQVTAAELIERFGRITGAELRQLGAEWLDRTPYSLVLAGDVKELVIDAAVQERCGGKVA